MDKDTIIKNIYYDRAGYGSIQKTYKEARDKESSITLKNVKDWFQKNIERTKQLKGYNSFINNEAFEEFQVDIAFFKAGELEPVLVMIDIFSKYATAIPIASKTPPDVIAGIMERIVKMGGKPKMIYSDNEGALNSNLFKNYCDSENIKSITTRSHVWVAERFIRTLKDMINKRIKNNDKSWKEVIFEVLLTYNNKEVHSATGMTPAKAKLKDNTLQVKLNLQLHRVSKESIQILMLETRLNYIRKRISLIKKIKVYG